MNKTIRFLILVPILFLAACGQAPATPEATQPAQAPIQATEAVQKPSVEPTQAPTHTAEPTATLLPPTATTAPAETPAAESEGQLTVLAPFTQVDRGMLPWVENFMAETGCLVNLKDFADYDRAMELIAAGGIDVVVGGGSSGRLISEGIVDEIDTSRVPSWGTIDPQVTSSSWNSADGKVYGVPYLWVPYVLMYNTDVFPTPPDSWDVVFEEQTLPDGKSNQGRVLAPYTAVYIGDAAKYLMSSKPEAGITDPYRLSSSQFSMALEQLYMQKGLLAAYWDYAEPMTDFAAKGYAATSAMPRVVKLMEEAGIPVASTIPQEGATASAFTNMLVKDAPHPVCAYQWMEYALDAKVQGDSAAAFGANPFVAAACEGASDSLSAEECERNGFSRFSEFSNLQLPTTDCGDGQNNCIPLDRWVQEFSALTNP